MPPSHNSTPPIQRLFSINHSAGLKAWKLDVSGGLGSMNSIGGPIGGPIGPISRCHDEKEVVKMSREEAMR